VFEKAPGKRDLYSWTTVICGLAIHSRAADALRMFEMMQANGIRPDDGRPECLCAWWFGR
jgi:pentatricopeptide repeat protein